MTWESFSYVRKVMNFFKKAKINISGLWVDYGSDYGYYSIAPHNLGAFIAIAIDRNHYKFIKF